MDETQSNLNRDWMQRAERWQKTLDEMGLGGISSALLRASRPLTPVAAQLLWIAQPVFALFGEAETVNGLVTLLEEHTTTQMKDAAQYGHSTSSESG